MGENVEEAPQENVTTTAIIAEEIAPLRVIEMQTEAGETISLTAEQVQQILSDNVQLKNEQHRTHVDMVLREAEERGVAPAVLNVAEPILVACSEEAEATIVLGDDRMNYFGAIARLLEVIPGVLGEKSEEVVTIPNPVQGEEVTLEQAEERARKRRAELAPKLGRPSDTAEV